MNKKFYITTPIYYVNDLPHIGHSYTNIAADILARHYRQKGAEVFFLTGTDEHGAKIAEAAAKVGKEPKQFVDELAPRFEETWRNLNISNNQFIRTTNPEHERLVSEFVTVLVKNGYIEKRKYEGLYCVGCERYYKPEELVGDKCPDHKKEPIRQSEENYFFLLSKLEKELLHRIERGELEIGPESRRNEVLSKIRSGLEDVSISRVGVKWGIPFPGDFKQTIYVWVDALLNYWTATKIYSPNTNSPNTKYQIPTPKLWPPDLQLMAKDILWFHAIIWPAMLIAARLPLPRKIFAHGFFTINGQKMSKTLGNVIDPNEVMAKFGADAVRYALLRQFPFGEDGDISVEKIAERYRELADTLGNLLQRTIVMSNKYHASRITHQARSSRPKASNNILPNLDSGIILGVSRELNINMEIESLQFSRALEKAMAFASELNQYINEKSPWILAKENKTAEIDQVLNKVQDSLVVIADALHPFMPETAEKMKKQLETLQPEPLFPKI